MDRWLGSAVNNGKNAGCGGYGYVLLYGDFLNIDINTEYCDKKFTLTGYGSAKETTNQRMEITSLIEALKRIRDPSIPIEVFMDSAYVLNCLSQRWYDKWRLNGWINSKEEPVANKELWEELISIIEDNMLFIKFNKVKSHTGIFYNEIVDKLAKKGLNEAILNKDN